MHLPSLSLLSNLEFSGMFLSFSLQAFGPWRFESLKPSYFGIRALCFPARDTLHPSRDAKFALMPYALVPSGVLFHQMSKIAKTTLTVLRAAFFGPT
jgi:hypothetical protein